MIAAAAVAAIAATAAPSPVLGDEISYVHHDVRSDPREGSPEHVSLDVPDSWEIRLTRTSASFSDQTRGASLVVDLRPLVNTVRELRAQVRMLRDRGAEYYREYDFRVNDQGAKIRARWVFSYSDAQTGGHWYYTSIFLIDGDRLFLEGKKADIEELRQIRRRVVTSYQVHE
jgi:hypothetical protein